MLCLKMFLKDHSIYTTKVTILILLLRYYLECDDSDVISTVSVWYRYFLVGCLGLYGSGILLTYTCACFFTYD